LQQGCDSQDAMPDALNVGTGRKETAPTSCPACKRVPLILLKFSYGAIEHARVGCLCRSVAIHHTNRGDPAVHENTAPLPEVAVAVDKTPDFTTSWWR